MSEVDKALFIVFTLILVFSLIVGGTIIYLVNRQIKNSR